MGEFRCSQCETFARFTDKHDAFHTECPVCEEVTEWKLAFDDPTAGVEF
jgi:phage FluMu protein Com